MMNPIRSALGWMLALGALSCAPAAFAAGNYTQNFASSPANWTVVNDTWSAAAGDYRNSSSNLPPALSWYTGTTWTTNYIYKVRAYSSWADTGNELGLVFGLTDSTHFHQVRLSMDGVVDLTRVNGNPNAPEPIKSVTVTPASVGLAEDTWFDLEVFVNGNTVTVKINDKVVIARESITPVNGRIGVVSRSNLARFDDAIITDNVATQLFRGNYTETDGTSINVSAPNIQCSTTPLNCYANITGNDTSGYSWPIKLWGDDLDDDGAKLQFLTHATTGVVTDYVNAAVETQPGHVNMNPDGSGGNPTHVLHQWVNQQSEGVPQVPYVIRPQNTFAQQHDLYLRFWLKYPDALTGYWQMPWQFKTPGSDNATPNANQLRVSLFATPSVTHNGVPCAGAIAGQWHWLVQADPGVGNTSNVIWQKCHPTAAVPIGKWFKVEIFFHRATSASGTGRVWVAIDSTVIIDHTVTAAQGGMYATGAAINRIMLPQMYGGDAWPRHQYVDDVEIWNGFPASASNPH